MNAAKRTLRWLRLTVNDPVLSDGRRASEVRSSMVALMWDCNRLIKQIEAQLSTGQGHG